MLTEAMHAGAFIVQEGPGYYSRDQVAVALNQTLLAGSPVYKDAMLANVTVATPTADAGNTGGAGTMTMDITTPVLVGVQNGNYRAVCVEPGTNAGTFEVFDPEGLLLGKYVVGGAAFANQVKFTISDATDFAAGDAFNIAVGVEEITDHQVKILPNDGSQVCAGLMVYPIITDGSTVGTGSLFTRLGEYRAADIPWPAGISAANKVKAIEELRDIGLIGR